MSQPPSDHGNVVDPDVLASRRARRAEVSEDAGLELRLFEAERRLGEVAAERDALRAALDGHERGLRAARQREWAEQQQRLEAQGEAAATRELAAGQVARLRERLAEAEAEVGLVAAERDRVRAALEREREAAAVDRDRRAALEREHTLLRAELERRAGLADSAVEAIGAARRELSAARDVEARLAAERSGFAEQVVAVERAVAAVRDRLGAAVRVLREQLDAERGGREAAEASVVALERELARRAEVEGQLRGALDGLRGELAAVRAGDGARVAALASRVQGVMAVAAGLRDSAARGRDAEAQALSASLAAMQARVAELTDRVAAAGALREELDAERAARWVAEAELDAERVRGDADREARAAAEARLAEVEAELAELRAAPPVAAAPVVDTRALASLRETLAGLQASAAPADTSGPGPGPALTLDLAAAAQRLRSMADAVAEPAPDSAPEPVASVPPPAPAAAAPAPARSELPPRDAITTAGPWLRDALVSLAADEPDIAELLLVALLPAQAGLARRTLAYNLVIDGAGTHRVALALDRARVELPGAPVEASVKGPLAALVPLAAGSAGRRLPGATVEGRWALRRLLKARRAPLGLAELAAAGVAPSPGLLLSVLARAVPARWTDRKPLEVDVAVRGADRWRIVASGDGPLVILPSSEDRPAPATLHVAAGRLAAVLAATAADEDAWVEGDPVAVRTLLSWLDRAQRAR